MIELNKRWPYCVNCEHFTPDGSGVFGTCQIAKDDHPEINGPDSFVGFDFCIFHGKFKLKEQ